MDDRRVFRGRILARPLGDQPVPSPTPPHSAWWTIPAEPNVVRLCDEDRARIDALLAWLRPWLRPVERDALDETAPGGTD